MTVPELPGLTMFVHALGWTLVHFVWQGMLIGAVYYLVTRGLTRQSAIGRYWGGVCCLLASMIAPIVTFTLELNNQAHLALVDQSSGISGLAAVAYASLYDVVGHAVNQAVPLIVVIWAIGVFSLSARTLVSWRLALSLCRDGVQPLNGDMQPTLHNMLRQFGMRRTVSVFESAKISVPTLVGWLKPVILLPTSVIAQMDREQLEMIIAHELGHLRRYDHLVNLVQVVIETTLFYHPVIRWMSAEIRVEREHCCDDLVIRTCGRPVVYAKALANLEGLRAGLLQPAIAATGGNLLARIRRIVKGDENLQGSRRIAVIVTVLAGLTAILGGHSDWLAVSKHVNTGDADKRARYVDPAWSSFLAHRHQWQSALSRMPEYQVSLQQANEPLDPLTDAPEIAVVPEPVLNTPAVEAEQDPLRAASVPVSEAPTSAEIAKFTADPSPAAAPGQHMASAMPLPARKTGLDRLPDAVVEAASQSFETQESGPAAADAVVASPEMPPALETVSNGIPPAEELLANADDALRLPDLEVSFQQDDVIEIKAVKTVRPHYPWKARKAGIEGFVTLEFNLNKHGRVKNIEVVEAFPEEIFNRSAAYALKGWKFDAPEAVHDKIRVVQTFDFNLREELALQEMRRSTCAKTGTRLCNNNRFNSNMEVVYVNPPSKPARPDVN